MADYLALDLSEIESSIATTTALIEALDKQQCASTHLKACLEADNEGLWAKSAASKLSEASTQIETTINSLEKFNNLQKEYFDGLQEKTAATGEVIVDACHYRYCLEQISAQIEVIENFGGWDTILWSGLASSGLDILTMTLEQEKAAANTQILKQIINEIKPVYLEKIKTRRENLENIFYDYIEPLMDFDEEIAQRASQEYEESISADTKTSIFLRDMKKADMAFGEGLLAWTDDALTGLWQLFSQETLDNLVDETAGVFNWFLSQGAVSLNGIFRWDAQTYQKALEDIRLGDSARYGFGDALEYSVSQSTGENASKYGWSYTLGNITPEIVLLLFSAPKIAKGAKDIKFGLTPFSAGKGLPKKNIADAQKIIADYPSIKSIKSIKDLPADVQEIYYKYSNHGWKGNYPGQAQKVNAGGEWKNWAGNIPNRDSTGNSVTYREWDIDDRIPGKPRSSRRFVTGSDGSVYYTDDHYKTFVSVEEGR